MRQRRRAGQHGSLPSFSGDDRPTMRQRRRAGAHDGLSSFSGHGIRASAPIHGRRVGRTYTGSSLSSGGCESSSDSDLDNLPDLCKSMDGRMKVLSGDLNATSYLRGILVGDALWGCGAIFRKPSLATYDMSKSVDRVDYFWSHSWKGPKWAKVCTLLVYHKGWKGWCMGLGSALATGLLLPQRVADSVEIAFLFGNIVGMLTFITTLLFWPCQDQVFLDAACIDQNNLAMKQAGIMSIRSFLKQSRNMVVVWDRTVFTRMWCVFELASWLKLKEEEEDEEQADRPLVLLPSFYGLSVVGLSTAICLAHCAMDITCIMRGGVHPILALASTSTLQEIVQECLGTCLLNFVLLMTIIARPALREIQQFRLQTTQLQAFSVKEAGCTCCALNHLDPDTGSHLLCDRKLIKSVIDSWFGSVEAFNSHVRSQVSKSIVVPMPPFVLMTTPVLLETVAGVAYFVRQGDLWQGVMLLQKAVSMSLLVAPATVSMILATYTMFATDTRGGDPRFGTMVQASALAAVFAAGFTFMDALAEFFLGPRWSFVVRGLKSIGVLCLTRPGKIL